MARDLEDGETLEVQGSAAQPYVLKNTGGVYTCSCPAWRNQGAPPERRTCKHLRALRGDAAETERVGQLAPVRERPAPRPDKDGVVAGGPPPILLAHAWGGDVDLTGWWMSEKLDGVRAYWDGKRFLSRLGNPFYPPRWFVDALPDHPLDGELWAGRKLFQRTVSIVRRQDQSEEWRKVSFLVFDGPGFDAAFEERLERCRTSLAARGLEHVKVHDHVRCEGVAHLKRELARVEGLGGEGLMMRRPGSKYEVGRSATLLKVKSFRDAEAKVIDHLPGTGKHKGRLGALLVAMPDGTRFSVGTGFCDAERGAPPPIGAIVTYRYQELSDGGVPRFPSYVGVRDDIDWDDLLREAKSGQLSRAAPQKSPSEERRRFRREGVTLEIALQGSAVITDVTERYSGAAEAQEAFERLHQGLLAGGYHPFER
jgi:DNA ligase-1